MCRCGSAWSWLSSAVRRLSCGMCLLGRGDFRSSKNAAKLPAADEGQPWRAWDGGPRERHTEVLLDTVVRRLLKQHLRTSRCGAGPDTCPEAYAAAFPGSSPTHASCHFAPAMTEQEHLFSSRRANEASPRSTCTTPDSHHDRPSCSHIRQRTRPQSLHAKASSQG
ncbi:hypothetical protein BCR34DRAFT_98739 [Clohesyomyces aquaticus]|uniref:Secreted protein n=1 Tax=Clohesyomyces aquaticus TaxID=1231657 RepID=A0A1Y1YTR0_9PLEO|nr:hypothetical protein BCR34DRAFT_98739 [Clohesyomyces aquaticus]